MSGAVLRRKQSDGASIEAVLVGISTGGPPAIQHLACNLPAGFGIPILVAQHMPPGFTSALARRLGKLSSLCVREARDGDLLEPGTILIAPAGWHAALEPRGRGTAIRLMDASGDGSGNWFRPRIDVLFGSAARFMASRTLALVMTGLGDDGTAGARAIKEGGGMVWAQDQATSAVWGMPRSVIEAGLADRVLALQDIPAALCALDRRGPVCGS